MSKGLIPYVIMESYFDGKRPYIIPEFGMVEEDKLTEFLLNKLVKFVYNRIDIETVNSINDIVKFWKHYNNNHYMYNSPWEASAVINGKWIKVKPKNEDLLSGLIKEKNKYYISSDDEDDNATIKTEETVESIIVLDEGEK